MKELFEHLQMVDSGDSIYKDRISLLIEEINNYKALNDIDEDTETILNQYLEFDF